MNAGGLPSTRHYPPAGEKISDSTPKDRERIFLHYVPIPPIVLENVFYGQKTIDKVAWNARITPPLTTVLVPRPITRRIA